MNLWVDSETRSRVALKHGTFKYFTGAMTTIWSWAIDEDDVCVWDRLHERTPPRGFVQALQAVCDDPTATITSHGDEFDRGALALCPELPQPRISQWRCSQAYARAASLPGGLDKLCHILRLPPELAKSKGMEYINLFCKPRADGNYNDRTTHPEKWAEFLAYAGQDIYAMREVTRLIPKWNQTPFETALRTLDQIMNARGVGADIEMAEAMIVTCNRAKATMRETTTALTDGEVESTTQVKRLRAFLAAYGVDLPDLKADTIERRLEDPELPDMVKFLLWDRLQSAKSSTSKYQRVVQCHVGGSLYGLLLYYGARPGRWAGRIFQPHNLMRPRHSQDEIDAFIEAVKIDAGELITDEPMGVAASSMRGVLVARKGYKLCVADLSNIEGRGLPWMAGEQWKLDAFAAFDAGSGSDMYKIAYGRMFNVDPESVGDDCEERQVGKVAELALGYYGGVGAFVNMSAVYKVNLDAMAEKAWPTLPAAVKIQAREKWFKAVEKKRTYDLAERTFIVCQSFVILWRAAHPATVKFWYSVQSAAENAIMRPDRLFEAGPLKFDRRGNWLRMHLPSGRFILYPGPRFDEGGISYQGVNPYNHQFCRLRTYSGRLVQNADEGISRDQLAETLPEIEAAGYRPLLTVHDSAVCEPPDSPEFTHDGLKKLITKNRSWNATLPLAAKGYTAMRFRK